jgi:hypothetical protein
MNEDDIMMNSSKINIIISWSMIKFFKNISFKSFWVSSIFIDDLLLDFFNYQHSYQICWKKCKQKLKKNLFCSLKEQSRLLICFETFLNMLSFWRISIRTFLSDWNRTRSIMKSLTLFRNCSSMSSDDSLRFSRER